MYRNLVYLGTSPRSPPADPPGLLLVSEDPSSRPPHDQHVARLSVNEIRGISTGVSLQRPPLTPRMSGTLAATRRDLKGAGNAVRTKITAYLGGSISVQRRKRILVVLPNY